METPLHRLSVNLMIGWGRLNQTWMENDSWAFHNKVKTSWGYFSARKKIAGNVRITMANKAMLTNLKSSLGLTKRPNVWLNIHTRTEHKMLHKKKISRIRRRREKQRHEIKINIYLMFLLFLLLCFSSFSVPFQNQFFCNSFLPQCLFPTPTSHSSIRKKHSPP